MLEKIYISNKYCSFELSIYLWILKNKMYHGTTDFNIDNNQKCFSVYYYDFCRSCDTEDWSNDAENTAARHRNKLQFNIYSHRKLLF